jgi:glycosyltransferase involved in cell wall biosynthesis
MVTRLFENSNINIVEPELPGIMVITSYPPRECGIATYSSDLVTALQDKFHKSFSIQICAVECDSDKSDYCNDTDVSCTLNTDCDPSYTLLAEYINQDTAIQLVLIQHEFGFFRNHQDSFQLLLECIEKPILIAFHTVLPSPNSKLREQVREIANQVNGIIVMTNSSKKILMSDYDIDEDLITVIPHGTHLIQDKNKDDLKAFYHLSGRKIISTFGLLSSGKNIETTIKALVDVVKIHPDTLFLIIGKTHPSVVKEESENYRKILVSLVKSLDLEKHVLFINAFLPLEDLLNYLQLTDVYVFTSKDPNQAVSGTFSYAISCGCPIISTPIPHAKEVLCDDAGIIIDFESETQLAVALNKLLGDETLRSSMGSRGLHRMAETCWENSATKHAQLFKKTAFRHLQLAFVIPQTNLMHVRKLTTEFGMLQFSKINQPDLSSGYTLDDNARALIAICMDYSMNESNKMEDLKLIRIYLNFIQFCQQPTGNFKNYVDENIKFTFQNSETNLDDSNGRAIWALGYFISLEAKMPADLVLIAKTVLGNAMYNIIGINSTRSMAFCIKGLYYANTAKESLLGIYLIRKLADRLMNMYCHESSEHWLWYEGYLTYANAVIPEGLLCAWKATLRLDYKEKAKESFDFLLSKTFRGDKIKVISNNGWFQRGSNLMLESNGGEQPIDVAYTIIALAKFYEAFKDESYLRKMSNSLQWFLGDNHLSQIIYNPCTGGCYDGLEEHNVNLNQGAESTVSFIVAKLACEKASTLHSNLIRRATTKYQFVATN